MASGLTTNNKDLEVTAVSFVGMVSGSSAVTQLTTESSLNATYNSISDMNYTYNSSVNNSNCADVGVEDLNQKLAFIIVNSIISLVIISGNVATIVAVLKTPVLGNVSNRFLVSLTVTDILVGVLASPLEILTDIPYFSNLRNTDKFFCLLQHVCLTIPARASLTSLTIIMIDRGFYIGSDSLYNYWTTNLTTGLVVTGIWCIAIVTGSVPFFYNQWKPCVKCERTAVLQLVYHNNFESIYLIMCWSIMTTSLIFIHSYSYHQQSKMTDEQKVKRQLDLTFINTFGLVFLFSVLCYLPSLTILILTNLDIEVPSYVNDVNSIPTQMNSSMNFIVYFAHNKKFRRAFIRILCPNKFVELEEKFQANLRQTFDTKIRSKFQLKNLTSKINSSLQLNVRKDIQEEEESICLEISGSRSKKYSNQSRTDQQSKPTLLSLATALDIETKRNVAQNSQNEIELESQSLDQDNSFSQHSAESDSQSVWNTTLEHDESVLSEPLDVILTDIPEEIDSAVSTPGSIWTRFLSWCKGVENDKDHITESDIGASSELRNKSHNDSSVSEINDELTDKAKSNSDRKLWMLNL